MVAKTPTMDELTQYQKREPNWRVIAITLAMGCMWLLGAASSFSGGFIGQIYFGGLAWAVLLLVFFCEGD